MAGADGGSAAEDGRFRLAYAPVTPAAGLVISALRISEPAADARHSTPFGFRRPRSS
ncbi:hypothetical protein FAGKG844_400018 [Frankia sp. AgKG'84/4]